VRSHNDSNHDFAFAFANSGRSPKWYNPPRRPWGSGPVAGRPDRLRPPRKQRLGRKWGNREWPLEVAYVDFVWAMIGKDFVPRFANMLAPQRSKKLLREGYELSLFANVDQTGLSSAGEVLTRDRARSTCHSTKSITACRCSGVRAVSASAKRSTQGLYCAPSLLVSLPMALQGVTSSGSGTFNP
jgi:hypothetical protein